jgi:hypothetical protein
MKTDNDSKQQIPNITGRHRSNSYTCTKLGDIVKHYISSSGPGSSVGIAPDYGLDGPGIESRWGAIFRTHPDRPWGPPSLLYNGYRVLPGGKAAGAWC